MSQVVEYVQIFSPVISAATLIVIVLQLSAMRKSIVGQGIQEAYVNITQFLYYHLNRKEYLEMSQESSVISEYYSLVDSPQQYYVIVQALDTMDFFFHLYRTKRIDKELWLRSEATCKAVMTIPKFKRVWDKIKDTRSPEFRELVDSVLLSDLQKDSKSLAP